MKKTTELPVEETAIAAETETVTAVEEEKIFVYLGPTIGGLIQTGTIYKAKSKDDIADIALAVSKIPKIKQLIVQDINIRSTQAKLRDGNNAVSNAFKEIAAAAAEL